MKCCVSGTLDRVTLEAGMDRLADALLGAFKGGQGFDHMLTRGEFREEAFMSALEPHFPTRFALSSGEVVNAAGDHSGQQDVIVSDRSHASPFVSEGRMGSHPIESVHASLQIKSTLRPADVADAVANLVSMKRLQPSEPRDWARVSAGALNFGATSAKPFAGIVAYRSDGSADRIQERFAEANADLDPLDRVDALVVLNEFTLCWITDDNAIALGQTADVRSIARRAVGGRALLFFYVLLMKALDDYKPPPLDLGRYYSATARPMDIVVQRLPEPPPPDDE